MTKVDQEIRWGRLSDARKLSSLSRSSLYRLREDGKIKTSKVGGAVLWDLVSLQELIEAGIEG